jgi:hypothetical protein
MESLYKDASKKGRAKGHAESEFQGYLTAQQEFLLESAALDGVVNARGAASALLAEAKRLRDMQRSRVINARFGADHGT